MIKIEKPIVTKVQELVPVPFQQFFDTQALGGILLLVVTVVALIIANSPWQNEYNAFWQTKLTIDVGGVGLSKALILWINDGLMAIFFFVVGLEIKREILVGELSSPRQAVLPIAAAIGGMVVPAFIYSLFNLGEDSLMGWGIPIATDIAFALGILSLLGNRVPVSLKIFLTALAIVDDIGAVVVITFFYTAKVSWLALGVAGGFLVLLLIANRLNLRHPLIYTVLGIGLWVGFVKSGVHATVAGVVLAMLIPATTYIDADEFLEKGHKFLDRFREAGSGSHILTNKEQRGAVKALEIACEQVQTPLQRLEHMLHPWTTFVIMPIFAFANAGITVSNDLWQSLNTSIFWGILAGLVLGKPIGVFLASRLVVWLGWATKPNDLNWGHIAGVACLAGIGFTLSLFVTSLAFSDITLAKDVIVNLPFTNTAKVSILIGSIASAIAGIAVLVWAKPVQTTAA